MPMACAPSSGGPRRRRLVLFPFGSVAFSIPDGLDGLTGGRGGRPFSRDLVL